MKQNCIKTVAISLLVTLSLSTNASTRKVNVARSVMVGNGIAKFVPDGFDAKKVPSFAIEKEPREQGALSSGWELVPDFSLTDGKANASLIIPEGTSIYGGGEVTGSLLRNGKTIKLWNTDSGAYGVDNGTRLYQSHPWMMGVRKDGTAFGILFDTTWKAELSSTDEKIELRSEGELFRVFIIDRESPQAVVRGLSELTGTMPMVPRWALGYQQCRFSYTPDSRVIEIADTLRYKRIPCDAIWMDIDYMDGYRIFTFNPQGFPDPKAVNRDLHLRGFHSVWMIDPGAKAETGYSVYDSGTANDVWVKTVDGKEYNGDAWPGKVAWPDFTDPKVCQWWGGLYKDFMANGIDGIWNDMNEPSVFDGPGGTMPENNIHLGGGNLPIGSHLMYHNAYGRLMVEASYNGMMAANPGKRPFLLSRSNIIGGQRYAAMWTGDNEATYEQMKLSVPMSITLGLSGQPFNGPDIGGFAGNTTPDLWGNWLGFGAFFPFSRGHASCDTNNKEPWAFTKDIEKESRMALERRYRLLPYLYTAFHVAHKDGQPVMAPVFFADPKDESLRAEEQAFMLGTDLLIIPAFAKNPSLPKGIWENLSLVKGDTKGKYQAKLKVRGGSIIPVGKIIQNVNENSFDPLTLVVCPDEDGKAEGSLYWDKGDGWGFQKGDYKQLTFKAELVDGHRLIVKVTDDKGEDQIDFGMVKVEVLHAGYTYKSSGDIAKGITVNL